MPTEKKYEESILITLLANDSEHAFRLLYERYYNRIYKLSIRYLKSPVLAQEIVQDVFLKLWFERKNMKAELPVEAWLVTVAQNKLINQLKKLASEWNMRKTYSEDADSNEAEAEAKLFSADLEKQVQLLINNLPQMQKQVYQFAKINGLSYNEIATRLNISPLTVKTHMARAIDKIRKSLAQFGVGL